MSYLAASIEKAHTAKPSHDKLFRIKFNCQQNFDFHFITSILFYFLYGIMGNHIMIHCLKSCYDTMFEIML